MELPTLIWGNEPVCYGYSEGHDFILENDNKNHDLGENGEKVTIMALSFNRVEATITLLDSVGFCMPNFAGTVLIVDNCSEEKEKELLRKSIATGYTFDINLVELDANYGVAGGRNRGIQHVKTPWVASVDNDMYFIRDPFKSLQKTVNMYGAHFVNISFYNKPSSIDAVVGGHLYLSKQENGMHLGHGTMFEPLEIPRGQEVASCLGTFLFGTAALFRKDTFLSLGGLDEGMFVGFEDTDFSITIFKSGLKIANNGRPCMVHDHKAPETKSDLIAEKVRHSRNLLRESADYFEKKHNVIIWNSAVDSWLAQREAQFNECSIDVRKKEIDNCNLPKIALVIDIRDWAFDHIAEQLMKHLGHKYNFTRVYVNESFTNPAQVLMAVTGHDIVHVFWRAYVNALDSSWCADYVAQIGMNYESFKKQFFSPLYITTSVYDHLLLEGDELQVSKNALTFAKNYTASSRKLYEQYKKDERFKDPLCLAQDGVDLDFFKPRNLERFDELPGRPLKIGWAGNSKWEKTDLKGINTIIKPAIENLQKNGYNVQLVLADRQEKHIAFEEMPAFYNLIDVYVCASICEGTPNTVLEAMACGLAVISTDVGLVPELFCEIQSEFIMQERTQEALEELIIRLIKQPQWLQHLSAENLQSIKNWNWDKMVLNFDTFFHKCLYGLDEEQ